MLRNKVGIKKMIADNGLVLLILLPQSADIPAVPVNMVLDGPVPWCYHWVVRCIDHEVFLDYSTRLSTSDCSESLSVLGSEWLTF